MPTIQQVAYPALLLLADQNARDLRNGADEFQPSISEAAYRAARDLFPRVVVDLPGRLPDASHAHDVGFQQGASLADWDLIVGEEYPTYRVPEGISEFGLGAPHEARERARTAFFGGDRKSYDWWREICRLLDKQLAQDLKPEGIDGLLDDLR